MPCRRELLRSSILFKLRWRVVGSDPPDLSVLEVVEQRRPISTGNLAGPHDLGPINVGRVVYPFVMNIVFGGVVDQHQMPARRGIQSLDELRAIAIPAHDRI